MDDAPNAEVREYWSGSSGQAWIEHEKVLDTLFQPVSDAVFSAAGLKAGERVLDIGCGTGAHSLTAARIVGATGRVLATDISAPFLARTFERAEAQDLALEVQQADAQVFGFEKGAFDLATSRFGVMFFADPAEAFANIAKALRPDGRAVFGVWAPLEGNIWWTLSDPVIGKHLGPVEKAPPNSRGPMGLANIDYVARELRRAEVGRFEITPVDVELTHSDVEVVVHMSMTVGSAGHALRVANASKTQRQLVHDGLLKAFAAFNGPEGLRVPARINLIRIDVP